MAEIDEVAKAAGVSISTVSYALSGKRTISAETRRRIELAVRELDYRPNAGARMLARRCTNIFAVTEPFRSDTHAPAHMAFVLATSIAARRFDYDVLLPHRRAGHGGHAPRRHQRPAERGPRARRGPRRRTGRAGPSPRHPVDLHRRAHRPRRSRLRRPRLRGGRRARRRPPRRRGPSLDRARRGTRRSRTGAPTSRRASAPGSNVERPERSLAHAVELPDVGDDRRTRTRTAQVRSAVGALLDGGATGLVLHCDDATHVAVLEELASRELTVPGDVAVVSVGFHVRHHLVPTAPRRHPPGAQPLPCDLAVGLAIQSMTQALPAPGVPPDRAPDHAHGPWQRFRPD